MIPTQSNQASDTMHVIDRLKVSNELARLRIPPELIEAALGTLPEVAKGVLIYGSRARGDHLDHSDLDLLALVPRHTNSRKYDSSNVTCYTAEQLRHASGTLFGMHIRRDGIIIDDTDGELNEILQDLEDPDPPALLLRIRHFSSILDLAMTDREEHLVGLCRLARFLLRTAIYTHTLEEGSPCFSVRELASRFRDHELTTLLSSDPRVVGEASIELLDELCTRLRKAVGSAPSPSYASLMTLVVGEWDSDPECATLALLAMIDDHVELDYSQLANVFL